MLTVDTTEDPKTVAANEETQRRLKQYDKGRISAATCLMAEGYDLDQEKALMSEPFTPDQQKFFDEIVACYPDEPKYLAIAEASKVVAEKWRDAVVGELDANANTTQHGNGPAPASD